MMMILSVSFLFFASSILCESIFVRPEGDSE